MQTFCQWLLLLLFFSGMFQTMYVDIEGRPERKPMGFPGVVITVLMHAVFFFVYLHAGTFSLIFRR